MKLCILTKCFYCKNRIKEIIINSMRYKKKRYLSSNTCCGVRTGGAGSGSSDGSLYYYKLIEYNVVLNILILSPSF